MNESSYVSFKRSVGIHSLIGVQIQTVSATSRQESDTSESVYSHGADVF